MARGAVWDEEGALVASLPRHDDRGVLQVTTYQEPGGRIRVVTADGSRVRVSDGETGALVHTLPGTLPVVTSLATFRSETGDPRVAAGAYESMMLVWDPEAGVWRYTSEVVAVMGVQPMPRVSAIYGFRGVMMHRQAVFEAFEALTDLPDTLAGTLLHTIPVPPGCGNLAVYNLVIKEWKNRTMMVASMQGHLAVYDMGQAPPELPERVIRAANKLG
jgi:hypothetical protein